jgi:hypothetical protein
VYRVITTYDIECDAYDCDNHVGSRIEHVGLAHTYEGAPSGVPENVPALQLDVNYVLLTSGWYVVAPPIDGAPEERAHRHFCAYNCLAWYYSMANWRARGDKSA